MIKMVPVKVYYFFSSNFVIILFQKLYKMTKLVGIFVSQSLFLSVRDKNPRKSSGLLHGHGSVWVLRCNWGQKEKYKLYLTCQTPLSKHFSTQTENLRFVLLVDWQLRWIQINRSRLRCGHAIKSDNLMFQQMSDDNFEISMMR